MSNIDKTITLINNLKALRDTILKLKESPDKASEFRITFKNKKELTLPFHKDTGELLEELIGLYLRIYYQEVLNELDTTRNTVRSTIGADLNQIKLNSELRDLLK